MRSLRRKTTSCEKGDYVDFCLPCWDLVFVYYGNEKHFIEHISNGHLYVPYDSLMLPMPVKNALLISYVYMHFVVNKPEIE